MQEHWLFCKQRSMELIHWVPLLYCLISSPLEFWLHQEFHALVSRKSLSCSLWILSSCCISIPAMHVVSFYPFPSTTKSLRLPPYPSCLAFPDRRLAFSLNCAVKLPVTRSILSLPSTPFQSQELQSYPGN